MNTTMKSKRAFATQLLKESRAPREVAKELGKRMDEVSRMLLLQVGEGDLTYADIVFSIPPARRQLYDREIEKTRPMKGRDWFSYIQSCRSRGLGRDTRGEMELYARCRDAVAGDMYLVLRRLEVQLHSFVRHILELIYPGHDDAWWRKGVPVEIRKRCVQTREEDVEPFDPYAYTNFIDLKRIIESHWNEFGPALPSSIAGEKKPLMRHLEKLNSIRNRVMHPTKLAAIVRDDYEFVCKMESLLGGQRKRDSE